MYPDTGKRDQHYLEFEMVRLSALRNLTNLKLWNEDVQSPETAKLERAVSAIARENGQEVLTSTPPGERKSLPFSPDSGSVRQAVDALASAQFQQENVFQSPH